MPRLIALLFLLGTELIWFSYSYEAPALFSAHGFAELVGRSIKAVLHGIVLFCVAGLVFGGRSVSVSSRAAHEQVPSARLSLPFLFAHLIATGFIVVCANIAVSPAAAHRDLYTLALLICAAVSGSSAILTFFPLRFLFDWMNSAKEGLICAVCVAACTLLIQTLDSLWWRPLTAGTVQAVKSTLELFRLPVAASARDAIILGAGAFQVEVGAPCSGVEGISMVLAFGAAWLWFFRDECRFPHALLLLPAGMAAIWCANVLRISALMAIGYFGWPQVAVNGFHSQAGWIAFVLVATGFIVAFGRVRWVLGNAGQFESTAGGSPAITAFLAPFLAILAASIVGRALSAGFEWLYPLRIIAAGVALWFFRERYRALHWRPSWPAAGAGVFIFAAWIGMEKLLPGTGASIPPDPGAFWIVARIIGAVLVIPIAEELAFRGFLLRRLQSADFENVDPRRWTWTSLLVSSIVFGLLHGDRWLAGALAGVVYAAVFVRKGSLGDAVLAHATTNCLLSVVVLTTGSWQYW